jgi:hypothetical protein
VIQRIIDISCRLSTIDGQDVFRRIIRVAVEGVVGQLPGCIVGESGAIDLVVCRVKEYAEVLLPSIPIPIVNVVEGLGSAVAVYKPLERLPGDFRVFEMMSAMAQASDQRLWVQPGCSPCTGIAGKQEPVV